MEVVPAGFFSFLHFLTFFALFNPFFASFTVRKSHSARRARVPSILIRGRRHRDGKQVISNNWNEGKFAAVMNPEPLLHPSLQAEPLRQVCLLGGRPGRRCDAKEVISNNRNEGKFSPVSNPETLLHPGLQLEPLRQARVPGVEV